MLLLSLPVTLSLTLDGEGSLAMRLRFAGIPLWRSPKRSRPVRLRDYTPRAMARRRKRAQRKAAKASKKEAKKQTKQSAQPNGATAPGEDLTQGLGEKISLITELVSAILGRTFHHARIKVRRLAITVGSPDAARTALIYGALSPALALLLETLEQASHLSISPDAPVGVAADFSAQRIRADISLGFRLHIVHLADIGLRALVRLLRRTASKAS